MFLPHLHAALTLTAPQPVRLLPAGPEHCGVAIAAGVAHTCIGLSKGGAVCVGSNAYGRLGIGDPLVQQLLQPGAAVALPPSLQEAVVTMAASEFATCLGLSNGTALCCGANRGAYVSWCGPVHP